MTGRARGIVFALALLGVWWLPGGEVLAQEQQPHGGEAQEPAPELTPEGAHGTEAVAAPRRWSAGPRRVAVARGRDLTRARRLGLGTRQAAQTLLWGRPLARWVAATRGRPPRTLLWPVRRGTLTQNFRAQHGRHRALDIAAPCGTPILAAHSGLVGYSDNGVAPMGNAVVLIGPGGWVTAYGHTRRTLVPAGAMVRRGQPIAEVGDTGDAIGCHVHFIAYREGRRLDPEPRMTGRPTRGPERGRGGAPRRGEGRR